jgi:hypothetical protein
LFIVPTLRGGLFFAALRVRQKKPVVGFKTRLISVGRKFSDSSVSLLVNADIGRAYITYINEACHVCTFNQIPGFILRRRIGVNDDVCCSCG